MFARLSVFPRRTDRGEVGMSPKTLRSWIVVLIAACVVYGVRTVVRGLRRLMRGMRVGRPVVSRRRGV